MKIKEDPLVSIIIPTYNRSKKLIRLVESIKAGSYKKIEIIVVDDCSIDNTISSLRKFGDVRVLRNENERYSNFSRNRGAMESNGQYLFFVDDDNVLGKETIKILLDTLKSRPIIGMVGPLMLYYRYPNLIWCAGCILKFPLFRPIHLHLNEKLIGYESGLVKCDYIPNAYMIPKSVYEKVNGFDYETFPHPMGETDLAVRIMKEGYLIAINLKSLIWHDWIIKNNKPDRPKFSYFKGRSRFAYFMKHAMWRLLFMPGDVLYFAMRKFRYSIPLKEKIKLILNYLRGIRDEILNQLRPDLENKNF